MVLTRNSVNKEVVVKVLSDGKQVVVELFNLPVLAEDLDIFHLVVDHSIESLDEFIFELISKRIARKVSETLVDQPQVHVSDGVVNMEIILEVKGVHKFPRVLVEHESGNQGRSLQLGPLGSSF